MGEYRREGRRRTPPTPHVPTGQRSSIRSARPEGRPAARFSLQQPMHGQATLGQRHGRLLRKRTYCHVNVPGVEIENCIPICSVHYAQGLPPRLDPPVPRYTEGESCRFRCGMEAGPGRDNEGYKFRIQISRFCSDLYGLLNCKADVCPAKEKAPRDASAQRADAPSRKNWDYITKHTWLQAGCLTGRKPN